MARLKDGSWDVHVRLERRLAVKSRFADLESYRRHLARLAGFHAVAEATWERPLSDALGDYPLRRKAPLLARDLAAIGGTELAGAPVPDFADGASALGGFYVLEGATLGGRHLLPLAERNLGLSAVRGASYLASYGDGVDEMWRSFGVAVEAHCATAARAARAVAAARQTFLALEDWLCGAPS